MKRILVGLVAAMLAWTVPSLMAEDAPAVGKGFAGMIAGKVVAKDGAKLSVEVTAIKNAWKHNKLENPQSLVGQKVTIVPSKKSPNIAQYAELLKAGDADSFDIRQDGAVMVWLELTKEQRAKVGVGKDAK